MLTLSMVGEALKVSVAASSAAERLLAWTRSLVMDDPSERDLEEDFLRLLRELQAQCATLRVKRGAVP
jgi:hypothetical protein